MAGSDLNSQDGFVSPSLQLGGGLDRGRYPNQFFDLAQQYMPPTIKELFRWCTFYYYNSPLIGAAITKISRYPITDLIFDDDKESIRRIWDDLFNKHLKMKEFLMEVNLDYHAYGNAFISMHLPFTRFLRCQTCNHSAPIKQWNWNFNTGGGYEFYGKCSNCHTDGTLKVKDIPYKDKKGVRFIRWNPENISVKHNEYTGRRIYMYTVPYKLKNLIQRGDKDILEDIPMVVIEALKKRRMIRMNTDNFKHLKRPTLAEQDQGWGKPLIIHVLKDMYYLYTLRRAQEAIAHEHIVPFDIIYPMPNAQQDPYIHTDLANWRVQIEGIIRKHRRDPNFKGVIPVPVGFGRLGGDGKAMMLTPELNYLTQTIVGGMGIPQEFLFGGLNFTGSSISLRTLENDFIQNRSQLLDVVHWVKDKLRIWLNLPDIKDIEFSDFRMADDVQRNQQLIGLNAQMKVSDQTMLTELGYDWEQEQQKMIEEAQFQNFLNDIRAKAGAKTQGEAGIIQYNYQQKIQELATKAQEEAQQKAEETHRKMLADKARGGTMTQDMMDGAPPPQMMSQQGWAGQVASPVQAPPAEGGQQPMAPQQGTPGDMDPSQAVQGGAEMAAGAQQPPAGQPAPMMGGPQTEVEAMVDQDLNSRASRLASKLTMFASHEAANAIQTMKQKAPDFGAMVEQAYNERMQGSAPVPGNMEKAPEGPTAEGMS
jgi:hypothetical protein